MPKGSSMAAAGPSMSGRPKRGRATPHPNPAELSPHQGIKFSRKTISELRSKVRILDPRWQGPGGNRWIVPTISPETSGLQAGSTEKVLELSYAYVFLHLLISVWGYDFVMHTMYCQGECVCVWG